MADIGNVECGESDSMFQINRILSQLIIMAFVSINWMLQISYAQIRNTEDSDSNLPPHLYKGKLSTGWEDRIDYTAETMQRLFWIASSGEPKWSEIRKKADSTIVSRGDSAIPYLLTKLSSDDARQRLTVNNLLKNIGSSTLPYLFLVIDSTKNNDIVSLSLKTIGDIADSSSIEHLVEFTFDTSNVKRSSAVSALASYHKEHPKIVNRFRELVHDSVISIRRNALRGLIRNTDKASIPKLIQSINDSVYSVRETVFTAFLAIPSKQDSLSIERRERIEKFHSKVLKYIENSFNSQKKFKEIPTFDNNFVVFLNNRLYNDPSARTLVENDLVNIFNLYRLLNGKSKQIWKYAYNHTSDKIQLIAFQFKILNDPNFQLKDMKSPYLNGQQLTKQFRPPIQ